MAESEGDARSRTPTLTQQTRTSTGTRPWSLSAASAPRACSARPHPPFCAHRPHARVKLFTNCRELPLSKRHVFSIEHPQKRRTTSARPKQTHRARAPHHGAMGSAHQRARGRPRSKSVAKENSRRMGGDMHENTRTLRAEKRTTPTPAARARARTRPPKPLLCACRAEKRVKYSMARA